METLASIIESILFVSGNEVAVKDISDKLGIPEKDILNEAKKLQEKKYGDGSGVKLLIFNKKLQLCSNKDNADSVATVLNPIRERELSRSMLEVAAIIAYKQPVTRTDLEEIRMCSCEYAIQNLLKLGVIDVVGRKEALGRPVLFGTTDNFLKRFQISSLDELPDYDEMLNKIKQMNGGDSNYLYKKDVYDEKNDPEHTDTDPLKMPTRTLNLLIPKKKIFRSLRQTMMKALTKKVLTWKVLTKKAKSRLFPIFYATTRLKLRKLNKIFN